MFDKVRAGLEGCSVHAVFHTTLAPAYAPTLA